MSLPRFLLRYGLFSVCLIGVSFACSENKPGLPDEPVQTTPEEAMLFIGEYLNAISERDTAAVRGFYVSDDRFVWIEDGETRYRSPDDVLEGMAALPVGVPLHTDASELSVAVVTDEVVHVYGPFTTTVGNGPDSYTFGGAISFILLRHGYSWRIVGGHTSAPRVR